MRDLFEAASEKPKEHDPLADRMRPAAIEEIVGQEHILGPGKLLRQLIEADRVPSLILWGLPERGRPPSRR